jgi:hypothetical protein
MRSQVLGWPAEQDSRAEPGSRTQEKQITLEITSQTSSMLSMEFGVWLGSPGSSRPPDIPGKPELLLGTLKSKLFWTHPFCRLNIFRKKKMHVFRRYTLELCLICFSNLIDVTFAEFALTEAFDFSAGEKKHPKRASGCRAARVRRRRTRPARGVEALPGRFPLWC